MPPRPDAVGPPARDGSTGELPTLTAVVSRFPAPSQTFIRRKLEGLRDAGMHVEVASTNFESGAEDLGFPMVGTAPWQHVGELRTTRGRREWSGMLRAVAAAHPSSKQQLRARLVEAPLASITTDIIHFEFSGIAVTYLDSLPELRRRARLVVSCRGTAEQIEPFRNPTRRAELARVFSHVDLVHCVSDDMRRTVEELGADPATIVVNRPAVPVARFAPLRHARQQHDGPLRVLSVGRLVWKKGIDDGLRAVAGLRARGVEVHYRVVGEGPERAKLAFLTEQLGLGGAVELLGVRTEQQVRDELGAADILLLPSLSEGISNVVLEAMSAGLAVVTTDCGGMAEVVTDGVDGLVVGVGDVGAMTERLATLAEDAELRGRLAAAAATTADRELDISRQVAVFVDAYRGLSA